MSFQTDLEIVRAAPWSQDALRAIGVRVARAVVPDLAEQRFYLVLGSDLPSELGNTLVGCSGGLLDLQLRPYIRGWSGRGVCIWADDGAWLAGGESPDRMLPASAIDQVRHRRLAEIAGALREKWLMHSLCHEAAHAFSLPAQIAVLPPEHEKALVAGFRPAVEALAAAPPADEKELSHHDGPWLRALCHLRFRVERLGFELAGEDLTRYALSPLEEYAAALADEPARLAGESFAAIRTTPIPTPFLKLFAADVARRSDSH